LLRRGFEFYLAVLCFAAGSCAAVTTPSLPAEDSQLVYKLFKQLIEINTTHSVGSVTVAAQAMRQQLLDAGFPSADLILAGPTESIKT